MIKKISRPKKQQISIQLLDSTTKRLALYGELYEKEYGEKVELGILIDELLNVAMNRDRTFKQFEKESAETKPAPYQESL